MNVLIVLCVLIVGTMLLSVIFPRHGAIPKPDTPEQSEAPTDLCEEPCPELD